MVFDPTSLITGVMGLFGKNKDEKNTRANMHVQQGMTLQQMRIARRWQIQDTRRMAQQAGKARRQSMLDQATYFGKTRRYAEKAGFNPLSVLGMLPQGQTSQGGTGGAMGSPGGPSPVMSSANADAFMMMGNAFGQTINQAGENQALRSQNEQMNQTIKNLTVRPKIDGIYAQREATPSYASAMGYEDDRQSYQGYSLRGPADPVLGFDQQHVVGFDPRRETDHTVIKSDPGMVIIDNPSIPGGPFSAPAIDGEVVDFTQYPTLAYGWGMQQAKNFQDRYGFKVGFGLPNSTIKTIIEMGGDPRFDVPSYGKKSVKGAKYGKTSAMPRGVTLR